MKHKNKKSATPPPKKVRRRMGYVLPIIFAMGLVIGYFANGYSKTKKPRATNQVKQNIHPPVSNNVFTYPFLNPLVNDYTYRNLNMCATSSLEMRVKDYVAQKSREKGLEIAVYYRDLNSNYSFGINENSKFSPSSLMKVPIMIAVLKKAQDEPGLLARNLLFNKKRENEIKGMEESTPVLKSMLVEGQSYSVNELVKYMILNSDNEATVLLLDLVTLESVQQVERSLGFTLDDDATFYSDIIGVKQYSSFFRTLYNASYLNEELSNLALEILSDARFGNGIRKGVPENIKVAHKYGSNGIPISNNQLKANQLHHFGIVYSNPKPFLLGIMVRGDDETKMEAYIQGITKIVYEEVNKTIMAGSCSYLARDIE